MDNDRYNRHERQRQHRSPSHYTTYTQEERHHRNLPAQHASLNPSTSAARSQYSQEHTASTQSYGNEEYRYHTASATRSCQSSRPEQRGHMSGRVQYRPGLEADPAWEQNWRARDAGMDSSSPSPPASFDISRPNSTGPTESPYQPFLQAQPPFLWNVDRQQQEFATSSLSMLPRSPTYPPASRRRIRSASNLPDSTFADAEDFHLFVQATAGLGPEQTFRRFDSSFPAASNDGELTTHRRLVLTPGVGQHGSPLQETPTTIHALQELASMPQAHSTTQHQRFNLPTRQLSREESIALPRGDPWLHPPDPYADEGVPIDEELPDYAASQAQAQVAQRLAATRRAQELQRRWQQSR